MTEVSVIIACYNAQEDIETAVKSALSQINVSVEVIVINDASTDNTRRVLSNFEDNRIKIIHLDRNIGPGGARNRALEKVTGKWVCILDSDDQMKPERLYSLLQIARDSNADIVCDNLVMLDASGKEKGCFFSNSSLKPGNQIYVNDMLIRSNLGYLKPVMRSSFIKEHELRYDENLRIGEDYHFLLDALCMGAKCIVGPGGNYLYKRHNASISYRIGSEDIQRLINKSEDISIKISNEHKKNIKNRIKKLQKWRDAQSFIEAIKNRKLAKMIRIFARHPTVILIIYFPVMNRIKTILGFQTLKPVDM